jgi:hypothetical protein
MSSALRSYFSSSSTTRPKSTQPITNVLTFPSSSLSPEAPPHLFIAVLAASSRRLAAFCAEASVLVFVLGILDRFLIKERIEPAWITGAFVLSLLLLALSVAIDVAARRWPSVTH